MNPSRTRILLLALLFAAWMLPGVVGRDPWKADEAYTVGLVQNIVETGNWVVPTLGADPFMEKPPVFFITAAVLAQVFSPLLPMHVAMRLACVVYVGLAMLFVGLCSRELNGPGKGWVAVLALLGCLGYVHHAHMLVTDLGLVTGCALALYGAAIGLRRAWLGGLLCGTGCGLAFLAKGLLGPGTLGLTILCLPIFSKAWRTRDFWRLLGGIVIAALPWLIIWPLALWQRSPKLFMDWFWDNNFGRFLGQNQLAGGSSSLLPYAKTLLYFACPALPLTLLALWHERRTAWWKPQIVLPLLNFLVTFAVLNASRQSRDNYALPMLVPLAVLAARAVDAFSPRFVKVANRAGFAFFSVLAVVAWFGWLAQFTGTPALVLERIREQVPDFAPEFQIWAFAVALLASVGWLCLLLRHRSESGMVVAHWTAGLALLYLLGMTLWLPVTNRNMSYRRDFVGLREALGATPGAVVGRGVGEPQRAMLSYFAGVRVVCEEIRGPQESRWLLIQGATGENRRPQPPDASWRLVWQGTHHSELFHLYRQES